MEYSHYNQNTKKFLNFGEDGSERVFLIFEIHNGGYLGKIEKWIMVIWAVLTVVFHHVKFQNLKIFYWKVIKGQKSQFFAILGYFCHKKP